MFDAIQIQKLSEAMTGTWLLVNNQPLSEVAFDIFVDDVSGLPFNAVMTAIKNARRAAKGRISVTDIMAQIERLDGRPSADEAFGIAIQTMDEKMTFVWNDEISEAWSVAAALMDAIDRFSAGRAFKEKYDRIVSDNRAAGIPVRWTATLGYDSGSRQLVLQQAIDDGRLSVEYAKGLFPALEYKPGTLAVIEQKAQLKLETKQVPITDRISELRAAASLHNMRKPALAATPSRDDGARNKRDSLAIFEAAEQAGVFASQHDKNAWAKRAADGESMKALQVMILEKQQAART